MKSLVSGYEIVEKDYGYWPSFHDDIIDRIEITPEGISILVNMKRFPEGMTAYPKVRLFFSGVKRFDFEGEMYGCVSIILDMEFKQVGELVEMQICSSLGTVGSVISEKVKVDLVQ